MSYYLLNTSMRLRDRRRFGNITIAGKRIPPGVRVPIKPEEIKEHFDVIFHLVSNGALEVRELGSGRITSLEALRPTAPVPVSSGRQEEKEKPVVDDDDVEMTIESIVATEVPGPQELVALDDSLRGAEEREPPPEPVVIEHRRSKRRKVNADG